MHHIMFDIDGTLVQSYDLDSECFVDAVKTVTGICIDSDWSKYRHVTDSGILDEVIVKNGLSHKKEICTEVKRIFIQNLEQSITSNPFQQIVGAASFLSFLSSTNNVVVSIATGGWYESAVLKLKSVGINFSKIPIASSNDHYSRTEIMKVAVSRATGGKNYPCTYFGDGDWDKIACEQLGFNFVLIGNKLEHKPNIKNFNSVAEVMACIGL